MRILFFGDGAWATRSVERLAQEGWTLLGVVARTNPTDGRLFTVAEQLGLTIFQQKKVNAPDFVSQVRALKPDLNLSVSYNQILGAPIREIAPLGFVNFHAGKLPNYRGRNVINWAIINGETEIGLTSHYMDQGIDTGDIILQRSLPIAWTDCYADVLDKAVAALPDLVLDTVSLIASGQVQRRPQTHLPGTYFCGRLEGDEWLDWSDSSRNLYNKVRAITRPGPGARTLLEDQQVIIWRACYQPDWPNYISTAGQVVGRQPGAGVLVKTGDSTLLVQEVQTQGGSAEIPCWSIGTRLGANLHSELMSHRARIKKMEQKIGRFEGNGG